jgi:Ulp1 family protease
LDVVRDGILFGSSFTVTNAASDTGAHFVDSQKDGWNCGVYAIKMIMSKVLRWPNTKMDTATAQAFRKWLFACMCKNQLLF